MDLQTIFSGIAAIASLVAIVVSLIALSRDRRKDRDADRDADRADRDADRALLYQIKGSVDFMQQVLRDAIRPRDQRSGPDSGFPPSGFPPA